MDRTAFIAALRTTPREGWAGGTGSSIRRDLGDGGGFRFDCPITAVCRDTTGTEHLTSRWDLAARAIGLPQSEALKIMRAADAEPRASRTLRAALLDACGLTGQEAR